MSCLYLSIFAGIENAFTVLLNIGTLGLVNFLVNEFLKICPQISVLIQQSLAVNFFIEPVQVDVDLVAFFVDSILKELE